MTQFRSSSTPQDSSQPAVFESNPAQIVSPIELADDTLTVEPPEKEAVDRPTDSTSLQLLPLHWWQGISIKRKATVLAIALGVVPVLTLSSLTEYFANKALEANVGQEQKARSQAVSRDLAEIAAERYQNIQVLAQTPFLTNASLRDETSLQQQQQYFEQFLTQGINSIVVIDAKTGNALVEAKTPDQAETIPNFKEIDYFQEVIKTKQPAIAPVRRSRATNDLSFLVAAPIFDRQTGELLYVIRTRTSTSYINQQIRDRITARAREIGESAQVSYYIADNQGRVFASGAPGAIEQPVSRFFPEYSRLDQVGLADVATDQNAIDSKEYLIAYTPLQVTEKLPDLDWSILVAQDAAVVYASQRQLLLTLVFGLGLTVLAVSALASNLAERATRPLLAAAEAVDKIGKGELGTRLELEGDDEVGILGTNINSMAAQLQRAQASQAFEIAQERLFAIAKGSTVQRRGDLAELFDQTLSAARELLKVDRIVIYRFDTQYYFDASPGKGVIAESVASGWPSAIENNVNDSYISEELYERYRQGQVLTTNDVHATDWSPDHMKLMDILQIKANLVAPIPAGDQLFGLVIAHACDAPREWQPFEINFLRQLGSVIGETIYRVDLLEQTADLAQEQRQLKETLQLRALQLLQEVDPISRGDLTTRAKVTADEIGTIADSYNATVDNLRQIVLQVQTAANQVVTTTNANETSVQTLSVEALRQAQEVAAALELVRGMAEAVQTVADNAAQAEMAVQEAAQTVEEGDAVMNRTVEGIQGIRSTVADTAKKVKHLGESSQKISKVVELISAFAAQTNMLALNASIEASRAGEEGRGFAVVANEVRALARQSAEATEEIRALVASIQIETNEVVSAMESGIEQVVTGTKLVDETRQSLNKITAVSSQISGLVEAIARSTVMQSQASQSVTETMQDVAAIADKTSAEATQVSSTFEQLRQVAQTLQAGVGQFKV